MPGDINHLRGHRNHHRSRFTTNVKKFPQAFQHRFHLRGSQMRICFGDGIGDRGRESIRINPQLLVENFFLRGSLPKSAEQFTQAHNHADKDQKGNEKGGVHKALNYVGIDCLHTFSFCKKSHSGFNPQARATASRYRCQNCKLFSITLRTDSCREGSLA